MGAVLIGVLGLCIIADRQSLQFCGYEHEPFRLWPGGEQSKVRAAAASARAACQEEIAALKAEASRLHQQLLSAQQKATAELQDASLEQPSLKQTDELARRLRAAQQQLADDLRVSPYKGLSQDINLSKLEREDAVLTQGHCMCSMISPDIFPSQPMDFPLSIPLGF